MQFVIASSPGFVKKNLRKRNLSDRCNLITDSNYLCGMSKLAKPCPLMGEVEDVGCGVTGFFHKGESVANGLQFRYRKLCLSTNLLHLFLFLIAMNL
jgi:hypothetical protein